VSGYSSIASKMEGVFGKIPILPQKIFLEWASKI
jgi:hypothetical protein